MLSAPPAALVHRSAPVIAQPLPAAVPDRYGRRHDRHHAQEHDHGDATRWHSSVRCDNSPGTRTRVDLPGLEPEWTCRDSNPSGPWVTAYEPLRHRSDQQFLTTARTRTPRSGLLNGGCARKGIHQHGCGGMAWHDPDLLVGRSRPTCSTRLRRVRKVTRNEAARGRVAPMHCCIGAARTGLRDGSGKRVSSTLSPFSGHIGLRMSYLQEGPPGLHT